MDRVDQTKAHTSSCVNVGLKICMAISGPMIMNFEILYISKCTPEDIPKRICIDIDVWWTYEHHSMKIGSFRGCVKVGRLVWFYVGISGKLSEVFNRKLKKGARAGFRCTDFRWRDIYLDLDLPPRMGHRWTRN